MTQSKTPVQTQDWVGLSGTKYDYYVYPISTTFSDKKPANYLFAKLENGRWHAVYAGETEDLSQRFDDHHAMPCIKANGATHLHVHFSSDTRSERLAEEADIRKKWSPSCNKQ